MSYGLLCTKKGMTRRFNEERGDSTPVTVLYVEPNVVTQVKTEETDGYEAIQVTTGTKKRKRVTKPEAGHFKKAKTEAGTFTKEFRKESGDPDVAVGDVLDINMFSVDQVVDVTSTSKGKGFAGTVKRWNFKTQDATHGNSLSHRAPGSTGQNQTPGRVFKGKKMAGQMGNKRVTVQNLKIVEVDAERGLILVKGGIPGAKSSKVVIKPAVKSAQSA